MPRWSQTLKQFVRGDVVSLAASAARTATGNGATTDAANVHSLSLLLDVTAASGTTPNLTVTIEESDDGTTWRTVAAFAAKTAVSTERKSFQVSADFVRAVWAITGTTPSFTFSVTGTSK